MLKGNFAIGKPLVERKTRQSLGKSVRDAIFVSADRGGWLRDRDCIVGFWVGGTEPETEPNVLPLGVIAAIDREEIAIDAESWLATVDRGKAFKNYQSCENQVLDRRILTLDGQDLGTARDVYFDLHTGAIEGYETWGGAFADPETGKGFVPATRIVEIGDRAVGVAPETVERMKERQLDETIASSFTPFVSTETVQKAFAIGKIARERVCTPNGVPLLVPGQPITSAHAAVAENRGILDRLYRAAGGEEGGTVAAETFACKMPHPLGQALGRRARRIVENPDGSIVAALGQIVTEREIARAIESRQERALLEAVGCALEGENFQQLCQTCDAIESCGITAWFETTAPRSDSQPASIEQVLSQDWSEDEQIQNALGRPVMKEIRDRNDSLILDIGDLITYHAVQQAIQAEMLARLLSSVYES